MPEATTSRAKLAASRWAQAGIDVLVALERVRTPLLLLVALTLAGTVGYALLLGTGPLDALYQTVITLSTVGFQEVRPFDGATKVFTIVFVVLGVGTTFYTITLLAAAVVEGGLRASYRRRVMERRIQSMRDHVVICGFGRVGEEVARELAAHGHAFAIVETDPAARQRAFDLGFPVVEGDAADEQTLRKANIEQARCLIAATTSDATNTYITLTVKNRVPSLHVVARCETPSAEEKLRLAGADRVVSPYAISGRRMALAALQPMMIDFMDELSLGRHGDALIAEIAVVAGSKLDGATIAAAFGGSPGTTVLGVRHAGDRLKVGPHGDVRLVAGDFVIVLAREAQLAALTQPADNPPYAPAPRRR